MQQKMCLFVFIRFFYCLFEWTPNQHLNKTKTEREKKVTKKKRLNAKITNFCSQLQSKQYFFKLTHFDSYMRLTHNSLFFSFSVFGCGFFLFRRNSVLFFVFCVLIDPSECAHSIVVVAQNVVTFIYRSKKKHN